MLIDINNYIIGSIDIGWIHLHSVTESFILTVRINKWASVHWLSLEKTYKIRTVIYLLASENHGDFAYLINSLKIIAFRRILK